MQGCYAIVGSRPLKYTEVCQSRCPLSVVCTFGLVRFRSCQRGKEITPNRISAQNLQRPSRRKSVSALSIIVGGWLVLNIVVVALLSRRREQPRVSSEK